MGYYVDNACYLQGTKWIIVERLIDGVLRLKAGRGQFRILAQIFG